MCDDCGVNLKQKGYFFIEDNLYCETHAKARVQPPEGYDVVAVYPNSKVELVWDLRSDEYPQNSKTRLKKKIKKIPAWQPSSLNQCVYIEF